MEIHTITNAALELNKELLAERAKLIEINQGLQKELAETRAKLEKVGKERLELLKSKEARDAEKKGAEDKTTMAEGVREGSGGSGG